MAAMLDFLLFLAIKYQKTKFLKSLHQINRTQFREATNLFRNGIIFVDEFWHFSEMVLFLLRNFDDFLRWYHFWWRILTQKSSTKIVPFQKRVKNLQQKWYHFGQKRVKNPRQKWYHFSQKKVIIPQQKGTISEKGQNSSTKMEPFQKRVTNCQQKWCHFRKGSKFLRGIIFKKPHENHDLPVITVGTRKNLKSPS